MSITMDRLVDLSPASLLGQCGSTCLVLGCPKIVDPGHSVFFDGHSDGLILARVPLPGAGSFSIQVDFMPAADGLAEQRLFHIQDELSDDRLLLEIRLLPGGFWFADSYFQSRGQAVILQDPALIHPCDTWYRYTVAYDGHIFSHTIDGRLEGTVALADATLPNSGMTSIGIRGNRLWPFCGGIKTLMIGENPLSDHRSDL